MTTPRVVIASTALAAAGEAKSEEGIAHRQQREAADRRFRKSVTIGCGPIATVAILWQLLPILLVPKCA